MNNGTMRGLTTIIVPCWNQVSYTQRCIAALKQHTRPPWELIVVNNGSTDETGSYLAGVRDLAAVPVAVVNNATNLGFPAAINQGLQLARGEYLLLLNNDVVVTDGWLDQRIALAGAKTGFTAEHAETNGAGEARASVGFGARSGEFGVLSFDLPTKEDVKPAEIGDDFDPRLVRESWPLTAVGPCGASRPIGLVGPMSNYAAPPQLVEEVPYCDMAAMPDFAQR
jgi:glycosyltransferase involved in cell wall biosynthesis